MVPDGAAKVSVVRFEKVPAKAEDLAQLVRWQVRKSVPFPIEQSQVSWTPGVTDASGTDYVVTVARQDIVQDYEQAVAAAGVQVGLVDLATFNLVNLLLAGDAAGTAPGDWLLVHVTPDASTMAIVRDGALLLFRHRPVEGEGSLSDLGHQTAMYYEDRLGGRGLSRAVVAARDVGPGVLGDLQALGRAIEQRVGKADRGDRSAGAGADRGRERQRRRARRHRRAGRRAAAGAGAMTMLRTNLATRPFYNERLVHWLIGGAAVLVLAFTAFNVSEYLRLSGRQGGLAADAARDEAMARTLTARAAEARRRIDAKSLERISAQAAEANGIIDARTFSWTALFDDIEATLPPTVMLTSITPSIGPGRRQRCGSP